MKTLLFTPDHLFFAGKNPLTRAGRQGQSILGRRLLRRAVRGMKGIDSGLVSIPLLEVFRERGSFGVSSYSQRHFEASSRADYSQLHAFADALDRFAKERGESSGLIYSGLSVFRISETRWLPAVLYHLVAYVEMLSEELKANPDSIVRTWTGASFAERMAIAMTPEQRRGGSVVPGFFGRAMRLLSSNDRLPRQAFAEQLADWKRFAKPTFRAFQALNPSSLPRVCIVAYKARTLRRIESVLPELQKYFQVCLIAEHQGASLESDRLIEQLKQRGVFVTTASESLPQEALQEIESKVGEKLRWARGGDLAGLPRFVYRGQDLSKEVESLFSDLLSHGAVVSAFYMEYAKRALEFLSPDLIIHFEEWELNRALTHLAKSSGVPTMAFYCLSPEIHTDLVRRSEDYLAVAGQELAEAFTSPVNWPKEKVEVIGDPLGDRTRGLDRENSRKRLIDRFELDSSRKIILLIGSNPDAWVTPTDARQIYGRVLQTAARLGAQVVLKTHPQVKLSDEARLWKELGGDPGLVIGEADLLDLAAGADLAVFIATTAFTQVLMAGTPALSVQPSGAIESLERRMGYQSQAGIPVLSADEELDQAFSELLSSPSRREQQVKRGLEYVVRHVGPLDGKAAERLALFVRKIVRKER